LLEQTSALERELADLLGYPINPDAAGATLGAVGGTWCP
jgi:hypothetical protein